MNSISSMLAYLSNHGMGRALRHRDYALYAGAGWLSNIGLWVQRIAVGWLTWELTGSWAWLGGITFAEGAVTVIVMPLAGTYADRVDRLWLARWTQLGAMFVAGGLAVLTLLGMINLTWLFVFMMLNGVVEGFWTPVRLGIPPNLVPREDMAAALGISASLFNLAQFVGPAIAGVFISVFANANQQFGYAFAFNAVTFLAYLIVLFIIRLRDEADARQTPDRSFLADFKQGIGYIIRISGLRIFLFMMMMASLCLRPFRELFAGISEDVFGQGADGLAILTASTGLGAVAGALLVANFMKVKGLYRIILIFFVVDIAVQIAFAFSRDFWWAVACVAAMGFAITVSSISGQILLQGSIHGEMRGRVMGIWGIIMRGGVPTGAMILGWLASFSGFQTALLLLTAVFLVVWIVILPGRHRIALHMESTPSATFDP